MRGWRNPCDHGLDGGNRYFTAMVFLSEHHILDFQSALHHDWDFKIVGSHSLEDLPVVERDLVCGIFALFLRSTVLVYDCGISVRAYCCKRRCQPIPRGFCSHHDLGVCDGHPQDTNTNQSNRRSPTRRAWQHPLAPLFSMFSHNFNLNPAFNVGSR
jgi:hypothetical protein